MPTVANPPNVVNITIAVNSARTANGRARRLLKIELGPVAARMGETSCRGNKGQRP